MSNNKIEVSKGDTYKQLRDENHKIIYVDKLSNFAVGPSVAKIGFGFEDPQTNTVLETITLTLPTVALIDMLNLLNQTLTEKSVKDGLNTEIEKTIHKLKNL
ncbi:hypothetical protein [Acinetobacter nosocomialis]|uniref:hypothetical protein n=1 Tax=Acinetobacter nosocomialis TaxID=106654 RepID=UPI0005AAF605|nr:hypothetical protein [Acinetobacter nosocomialis]MDO7436859.1 hypothetical protein [Acinetobacter nosocomialis]